METQRPIQFCLVIDDFGVEYIGKQHADHLAKILKKYHNITEDWEGKKTPVHGEAVHVRSDRKSVV